MLPKKIFLIACAFGLVTSGCFMRSAKEPATTTPVPTTAQLEENTSGNTQETTVSLPTLESKTPSSSSSMEVAKPVSNASAPMATQSIAAARANAPLATPVPDTPVFKNESLISLDGRRLSPLAYATPSEETEKNTPWHKEQLKYGLYYSFVKAGTAYIKNRGLVSANGRPAYLIQTTAFSASVIDSVFKVRDVNYSWLDAETFYSLGYTQSLREGNYKRDEWITFDYNTNTYYGEIQKKGDPREISGVLTGPVLDMLTSLYYVRSQPLHVGQDVILDIVNREEKYPMVVKVLSKETVKTPAGKFKCIVVEPQFRGEGIFVAKGKSLKVWLTDDKYKMPVKMKTEVFIGSVSAELLEYKRN